LRAGLDVTFIEQWPAGAEAMRTNGVWAVIAAGIESGVLAALPTNADLLRSARGA
jgi:hypothetical protein